MRRLAVIGLLVILLVVVLNSVSRTMPNPEAARPQRVVYQSGAARAWEPGSRPGR